MKFYNKISLVGVVVSFLFGMIGANSAHAATAPDLGTAANFAVLAGSAVSDVPSSVITGHVGLSPTGGTAITGLTCSELVGFNIYDTNAGYAGGGGCLLTNPSLLTTAKNDLLAAYNNAAGQTTTTLITADLGTFNGGTLTPGVYANASSVGLTGTLTLDGGGNSNAVFIFKAGSTLTTASNAQIILANGAQACNVFWQVGSSATLGTATTFKGNIMAKASITDSGNSIVLGRLLASDFAVTLNKTTVTKQTCVTPSAAGGSSAQFGTINVVKTVINDNGGTKTVADFPLFVNGTRVTSGQTNNFPAPAGTYTITETSDSGYTRTFSGDCNSAGQLNLNRLDNAVCIVTNNDIGAPVAAVVPPLIDVVKVPSPLALPNGPGQVTYNYTVRNIGTIPMTNITMVGDSCSPITMLGGDTNGDGKLDVNETWVYSCVTMLSETHTNTVVATGWANGISAVDIANATVIVGAPVVPPLIHVTKVPNPLALSAGGGWVTYTNEVTNPGTVPLTNVRLTDDKCGPVTFVSGDGNGDNMLEPGETWIYTCQSRLTKTTVNTVIARGEANGLTVRDFAVATVIVAVPTVPNTGVEPSNNKITLLVVGTLGLMFALFGAVVLRKSKV